MTKVRTLSRTFMKGHPKEGQPTYFMEKVYNSLYPGLIKHFPKDLRKWRFDNELNRNMAKQFDKSINETKHHTIRMGRHFKANDELTLAVWNARPYHSKQVKLWIGTIRAIDIIITKTSFLKIYKEQEGNITSLKLPIVAKNDGLSLADFEAWFNLPVGEHEAQILIWSPEINY